MIVDFDTDAILGTNGNTRSWVQNDLEIIQNGQVPAVPILAQVDVLLQLISRSETIVSDLGHLRPGPRIRGYCRWRTSLPLSRLTHAFGPFGNKLGGGIGITAEPAAGIDEGTLILS